MGKSAGHGLEENTKIVFQLLVVLNGSGLIASLAFIGAIIDAELGTSYIPFYWCVIVFSVGLIAGILCGIF